MRVRIAKAASGVLDGVSLGHLRVGFTYDVVPSLAHYLVGQGIGVEVAHPIPDPMASSDQELFEHLSRGVSVGRTNRPERAVAHDRPPRRRRKSV